jgi:hypothetical protein
VVGGPADAGAPDTGAADVTAIDTPDVSCGAGQTYCLDRCVSTRRPTRPTAAAAAGLRHRGGLPERRLRAELRRRRALCSSGDAGLTCVRVQTDSAPLRRVRARLRP